MGDPHILEPPFQLSTSLNRAIESTDVRIANVGLLFFNSLTL